MRLKHMDNKLEIFIYRGIVVQVMYSQADDIIYQKRQIMEIRKRHLNKMINVKTMTSMQ